MNRKRLIGALKRMKVETGSLVCLGCGWENSCGTRGCRILREAAEALEKEGEKDGGDERTVRR